MAHLEMVRRRKRSRLAAARTALCKNQETQAGALNLVVAPTRSLSTNKAQEYWNLLKPSPVYAGLSLTQEQRRSKYLLLLHRVSPVRDVSYARLLKSGRTNR